MDLYVPLWLGCGSGFCKSGFLPGRRASVLKFDAESSRLCSEVGLKLDEVGNLRWLRFCLGAGDLPAFDRGARALVVADSP